MLECIKFDEHRVVGGIQGWYWHTEDTGAWDGPKNDWDTAHQHNISAHVKQYRTVIQAGGNLGMYPRLLSRMFDTVYTFEPDFVNYKILNMNADQDNIISFQSAVGNVTGSVLINRPSSINLGMHSVEESDTGQIRLLRLDDIFPKNTDVDLLMLDIEGFESYALDGARALIKRCQPVIFIERPCDVSRGILRELGYTFVGMSAMDGIFIVD
jgi:FkbM family methyltransferase